MSKDTTFSYSYSAKENTLSKSIEVVPEMLKTNLLQRFIRSVVRIFAPML